MPNIFSSHKNAVEEPYVRPSLSLQISDTESIRSDETASNNPGPGRTIGLLFNLAGEKVERFLNNVAVRRKLGPEAILKEIRDLRRYEDVWSCRVNILPPTTQEYSIYKKRCRKLLKYCRSYILETQLKALDAVTNLAIEDPYVRQVLADILHHSYLKPKYNEQELHIRSCKAIISVKEKEVYELFLRLYCRPCEDYLEHLFLYNKFEILLKDSDISFLLGRLLQAQTRLIIPDVIGSYLRVAAASPHIVEWGSLREIFERSAFFYQGGTIRDANSDIFLELANHFPILEPYRIDCTSGQIWQNWTDESLELPEPPRNSTSTGINGIFTNLSGFQDLAMQLQYLDNLDYEIRGLLQDTVLLNKILITYAYTTCHCRKYILAPREFAHIRTGVEVLLNYFSYGNLEQQTLAEEAIIHGIRSNRYFKSAVSQYGVTFYTLPPLLLRPHTYLNIKRKHFLDNLECDLSRNGIMHADDILQSTNVNHRWIEVNGDCHPFDVTGHFPALAGIDTSGKELYVAEVVWNYLPTSLCSYVPDGARRISIVDRKGETRQCSQFRVLVLRHDPSDFRAYDIPEGAKFQTGNMYWIHDEEHFSDKWNFLDRTASEFSWVEYENRWLHGGRFGEQRKGDGDGFGPSRDNADNAVEDVVAQNSGQISASTEKALVSCPRDKPYQETISGMRLVQEDALSNMERQKDATEGYDMMETRPSGAQHVVEEEHQADEEVRLSSSRHAEKRTLADATRGLEEDRTLETDVERREGDAAEGALGAGESQCDPQLVLEEEQRGIEAEKQLLFNRIRELEAREREIGRLRAVKLQESQFLDSESRTE